MIKTQLFICETPLRAEVTPVTNSEELAIFKKPHGGLWTSTWRSDTQDSGWVEYLVDGNYGDPSACYWYLLTPCASAKLYRVNSNADLHRLLQRYSWNAPSRQERIHYLARYLDSYSCWVDFEALAKDYDGLRLTWLGYTSTHSTYPDNMDAWSCESTCWFRWKFESAQLHRSPAKEIEQVTP